MATLPDSEDIPPSVLEDAGDQAQSSNTNPQSSNANPQSSNTNPAPVPLLSEVFVENAPLPYDRFPPSVADTRQHGASVHVLPPAQWLRTVDELAALLANTRQLLGSSNFAEMSTPAHSSKTHLLTWLGRFRSLKLAEHTDDQPPLVRSAQSHWPWQASHDLTFPVNLSTTDGAGMSLPGLAPEGQRDSEGYPLFYPASRATKKLATRGSGTLFRTQMSRDLVNRFRSVPDPQALRVWSHMFSLSSDADASAILMQRVKSSSVGDNHIMLLLKAYLAYFDSIAATVEGTEPRRNAVPGDQTVVDVTRQTGWVATTVASSKEIVNTLGGSSGYQEFWAYCCFDSPPIYAAKVEGGDVSNTVFGHYQVTSPTRMVCLCDYDAFSTTRRPAFYGEPTMVLSFIETYVQRYGLQTQANEALQIAMQWPALCLMDAHVSLPRPMHTADWLAGEVESTMQETAYSDLLSSSPVVVLASTLAGAATVYSQVYDLLTLLVSDHNSWQPPSASALSQAMKWLIAQVSAPGVGWHLVLNRTLGLSRSFSYLTGLDVQVVQWEKIVSTSSLGQRPLPAHLRLLQPFWVQTSVDCILPWHSTWLPKFEISGTMLSAETSTLARLQRLGVLDGDRDSSSQTASTTAKLGSLSLRRDGRSTVEVDTSQAMDRLRVAQKEGLRVIALPVFTRGS